MSEGAQFTGGVPSERQSRSIGSDVEGEDTAGGAVFLGTDVNHSSHSCRGRRTRLVALCKVQIDSLLSSLSPRLYGKELPFAIAD